MTLKQLLEVIHSDKDVEVTILEEGTNYAKELVTINLKGFEMLDDAIEAREVSSMTIASLTHINVVLKATE